MEILCEKEERMLCLGDVVVFDTGGVYLIACVDYTYSAFSMCGVGLATGTHNTLLDLIDSMSRYPHTVYSAKEYKLQIVKSS